jgi:predicted CXXCH cytochrome family protein
VVAGTFSAAYAALSTAPTGQKTWYWQNPLPQGNLLYGVDAPGDSHVWAVGGPGVVLHSSDDGAQWEPQDPQMPEILRAVDFVDSQTGWVVGGRFGGTGNGAIKRTTDGGSTWTTQTAGLNQVLYGVSMVDTSTGWVVAAGGYVLKTSNGGSNWSSVRPTTQTLWGVSAVDATHAWAVGAAGTMVRTTDGSTWATQTVPTAQVLNAVSFVDTQTGYAVGNRDATLGQGTVLKTSDGGSSWTTLTVSYLSSTGVPTPLNTTMRAVSFRDASTGWIAGDTGLVLFTQDGGATWTSQKSGAQVMYGVAAGDGATGHLVGANGVMLRTVNDGLGWLGQQQGTTARLNSGSWTGPTSGIVVGAAGLVMTTEDAGDSWASRTLGPNDLYCVKFGGTTDGWIVGSGGFIRKTEDAGASWTPQVSGTTQILYSVTAVDALRAWAVGAGGTILKTTDGGATWVSKPSGTTAILYDVYFVDADQGWAVGASGTVRRTVDGGETWSVQPSGLTSAIYSVHFSDANTGWLTSTTGRLRKTTNGGATWVAQTTGTTLALYSVEMADANTGWAVGGASTGSVILRTTNGGTTWAAQDAGFRGILRQVTVASPDVAGVVGDAGAMRRTFDAGDTWETTGFWSIANYRDIAFLSDNEGWAVGEGGAIAHTHDGGRTWGAQQSGGTNALYAVDFVPSGKGWAVGSGGAIRTTVSHTTWTSQTSGVTSNLWGVDFIDEDTGWAAGAAGTLLKSSDGGSNWTTQTSNVPTTTILYGVSAIDTQTAVAWGAGGTIARTTDGGSTWATSTISAATLYGGHFVDSQTGWVTGTSGTVMKTTNGGASWTPQSANAGTSALWNVWFTDADNGYLVGAAGTVRKTVDGGDTWATQLPGTSNILYAVAFTDEDHGWTVGAAGTILRTTDNTPPETQIVVDPPAPNGNDGWFLGQPQISFVSNEPGLTYYSWVSATGPWTTFSAPIVPPHDGEQTIHWYSVDPGGNKEAVQSMTGKVDATPPSTPSTPAATPQSSSHVLLTWDASVDLASGMDYYEVRNYGSLVGTSPVNSMTLGSLSTETVYSFSVAAVDVAGNVSDESGSAVVSTLADAGRPPAVVDVAASPRGAIVNWGESTGTVPPVSYRVWRSVAGAQFSAIATTGPGLDRSYVDITAPRMVELRYSVSVHDARGDGALSAPTSLSAATLPAPPPPAGLSARNTASVTLTWTPVPYASGYHVYRSTASTGTETTLTPSPVADPTYHDATTAAYTEYWYSVATVDASDNVGPPSARVYIRTEVETSTTTTESPHGAYSGDTNMCAVCHRVHSATGPLLLRGTTSIDAPLCLSCHDGTSASDVMSDFMDDTRDSRHPVPMGSGIGSLQCSSCHGVHSAEQTSTVDGLLRATGATAGNNYCYQCHGSEDDGPRGALQVFEASSHGASIPEPDGTKIQCLSCHIAHTSREASLYPYSADDRCLGCHATGGLAGGASDIATRLAGADHRTRHDLLASDSIATGSRLGCSNCHEVHTSTSTTPSVDPDRPTTTNTIAASSIALCLRCHDSALPASEDTSPWAEAPLAAGGATVTADIASVWGTNVHGGGASDSPDLKAGMGYQKGDDLNCASCHDAHGSINRYALLETVVGTGTANTAENLTVAPAGSGWDLRFFCDSCHDLTVSGHTAADLTAWPLDCTVSGCHNHAGNGL